MRMVQLVSVLLAFGLSLTAGAAQKQNAGATFGKAGINQVLDNPSGYLGKSVALNGKVDRVLGSGDFILKSDAGQSIMVLTSKAKPAEAKGQQAGTAAPQLTAPQLKEGDNVQVSGKVDQLVVTDKYDVLNLRKNSEGYAVSQASTPVLLAKSADIRKG